MSKVVYATILEIPEPLLLSAAQLFQLDKIFDNYRDRLLTEKNAQLEAAADAEMQSDLQRSPEYYSKRNQTEWRKELLAGYVRRAGPEVRRVTVDLPNGKQVEDTRFETLATSSHAAAEVPLGFSAYCRIGEVQAIVNASSDYGNRLRIKVEPSESEAAQDLYGALRNWAADVSAPRWQRVWVANAFVPRMLLAVWVIMTFLTWANPVGDSGRLALKREARQLVSDGITDKNRDRAVTLILAIESDYRPPAESLLGKRFWVYFWLGVVGLGIASIVPNTAIGLWGGKGRLEMQQRWIRFVSITVPSTVLSMVILPRILHTLGLM